MTHPKETIVAVNAAPGGPFVTCGGTIVTRRVEVVETPAVLAGLQTQPFNPQGLQYQLWDQNASNGAGAWGATKQLSPGEMLVVGEPLPQGRAGGPIIGSPAQTNPGGVAVAAITPIRVMSATAVATLVIVREYV